MIDREAQLYADTARAHDLMCREANTRREFNEARLFYGYSAVLCLIARGSALAVEARSREMLG